MKNENQCPRCKGDKIISGKIASSFILPQWGLFHSFKPNSKLKTASFRIQKELLYCPSCGLLWQETREN